MALRLLLMMFISPVKSQGTFTTQPSVTLVSSFEQDGRQFACPGEYVIFTCKMNNTVIIRLAAEPFIRRSDPVSYTASDAVGNSGGTEPNDPFQANLVHVQRESNQSEIANFIATLKSFTTDETTNTVVECADLFSSDRVQRKLLTQASQPSPPTELNFARICNMRTNSTSQPLENGSVLVNSTCHSIDLVLTWKSASGEFDLLHYLVDISGNVTNVTTTFFRVSNMPNTDYQVFVSTVSKCQKTSPAVMINTTAEESIIHLADRKDDINDHIGFIIGGSIGGLLLTVLLIVLLVAAIVWRRMIKEKGKENQLEMKCQRDPQEHSKISLQ